MSAHSCSNCHTKLEGPICHQCGQKYRSQRWSASELIHQFFKELTNIEKGFLFTGKLLFTNPGVLIKQYWNGITIKTYNPFRYMIIWVAINLIISFWFGIDDLLQENLQPTVLEEQFSESRISAADQKFDSWLNVLVLLLLPFFSFLTKLLFAKGKKNYAEHLIMNAFMMGQQSFISSFNQFLFWLLPGLFMIYIPFNFLVGLVYNSYVLRQVFEEKLWITVLKALLIGILGMVVFFALISIASGIALWTSG